MSRTVRTTFALALTAAALDTPAAAFAQVRFPDDPAKPAAAAKPAALAQMGEATGGAGRDVGGGVCPRE